MRDASVLVTGSTGFCAGHLARRLRQENVRRLIGAAHGHAKKLENDLWDEHVVLDIRSPEAVGGTLAKLQPDFIFHLAGVTHGSESDMETTNALGTRILLDAIQIHAPAARVLLVGTAAEYGEVPVGQLPIVEEQECAPVNSYGRSKFAGTKAALEHFERFGTKLVIARPFNVVGAGIPPSLVVGAFIERILRVLNGAEANLRVGNLDARRDFVAVEDVVDAYVNMLKNDFWGEVINVCSGIPTAIRSLVTELVRLAGRRVAIQVDDALVRHSDVPVSFGSWRKANRLFGFTPHVPLMDALAAAWQAAAAEPRLL